MKRKKRLSFEPIDKDGIPLTELITIHQQFRSKHSLPGNLGDGFLYATNPVFRNIRDEFLRRGFSFTNFDNFNYFAFPLMCLDDVIAAKSIPYRNNFRWLQVLEKSAARKFTLTELKRSELQFNYLFHESAHCIAHSLFFGVRHLRRVTKNSDSLVKILMGEAFANTVEALGSVFADGEIASYFLDANCHFRSSEKEVKAILRATHKDGFEAVAKVLFAAFLYSNFLHEKLTEDKLKLILRFSGLKNSSSLKTLVKVGLSLSEQFRTTTTQLHLLKIGFPTELGNLMSIDPLKYLEKNENFTLRNKVNFLMQLLCAGLDLEAAEVNL